MRSCSLPASCRRDKALTRTLGVFIQFSFFLGIWCWILRWVGSLLCRIKPGTLITRSVHPIKKLSSCARLGNSGKDCWWRIAVHLTAQWVPLLMNQDHLRAMDKSSCASTVLLPLHLSLPESCPVTRERTTSDCSLNDR